jgi:hypothetical protein
MTIHASRGLQSLLLLLMQALAGPAAGCCVPCEGVPCATAFTAHVGFLCLLAWLLAQQAGSLLGQS